MSEITDKLEGIMKTEVYRRPKVALPEGSYAILFHQLALAIEAGMETRRTDEHYEGGDTIKGFRVKEG